jgi:hypothetical protein
MCGVLSTISKCLQTTYEEKTDDMNVWTAWYNKYLKRVGMKHYTDKMSITIKRA